MFFVSSDNQFGFKRGLISSHAIYAVKSVVNEYRGILSGSLILLSAVSLNLHISVSYRQRISVHSPRTSHAHRMPLTRPCVAHLFATRCV